MSWDIVISSVLAIVKWLVDWKAGKKLSDAEFIAQIEAHQRRRSGVGRQAQEFEDNVSQALKEMQEEEKEIF